MKEFYVVKLGGNLYVATKAYGLFQETTNNIEYATKFSTEQDAQKIVKKTIGGTIEKYYLIKDSEYENEIGYLKEIIASQRNQITQYKELLGIKEEEI